MREWVGVLASAGVLTLSDEMLVSCDPAVVLNLIPTSETLHFFTSLEFIFDKVNKIYLDPTKLVINIKVSNYYYINWLK